MRNVKFPLTLHYNAQGRILLHGAKSTESTEPPAGCRINIFKCTYVHLCFVFPSKTNGTNAFPIYIGLLANNATPIGLDECDLQDKQSYLF